MGNFRNILVFLSAWPNDITQGFSDTNPCAILGPMNKYELTVVLDGKAGSAKVKKMTESLGKVIDPFKGKITTTQDWGVKKLAYKIAKNESGLFTFFELDLDPVGVKALNDKLRTDPDIIRFLLINVSK